MADLSGVPILFINNFPGPSMGGGEAQTLAVVRGCLERGMKVYAAVVPGSGFGGVLRDAGVDVVELPMRMRHSLSVALHLRRLIFKRRIRVVVGTGYFTNLLSRLGALKTGVSAVNIVHVVPGASAVDGGSRAALAARWVADRVTWWRAHAIVAVSQAVADGLLSQGQPRNRVRVIRNGIDATAVRDAAAAGSVPPGFPSGRPVVGTVARLERVKGIEYFVRAAAIVAGERSDATFAVAGTGTREAELRELSVAIGIADRLHFVGYVSAVEPFMAALDLLVVPSLSEGFGLAAAEAMALARPVVATRVGGNTEVVADGVTGLLVPPQDAKALAAAILAVLDDPESARAMGAAGVARVEAEFSADTMVEQYLRQFEELIVGQGRMN